MKKLRKRFAACVLLTVCTVLPVFQASASNAVEVTFSEETCPLHVYTSLAEAWEASQNPYTEADAGSDTDPAPNDEEHADDTTSSDAVADSSGIVDFRQITLLGVVDSFAAAVLYEVPQNVRTSEEEEGEALHTGYVLVSELQRNVPALVPDTLDSVQDWTDISYNNHTTAVAAMQQSLMDLGYLQGAIDGSFGPATRTALNAFLTGYGLSVIDTVDSAEWFLLQQAAEGGEPRTLDAVYPPVYTVEERFASIYEMLADPSVLDPFTDPVWQLCYDVIDGIGTIYHAAEGKTVQMGTRPIDRIDVSLNEALYLEREVVDDDVSEDTGSADSVIMPDTFRLQITPSFCIRTEGALRLYIQSAVINSGNQVQELRAIASSSNQEHGAITETDYLEITPKAAALIRNLPADATLTLRLRGVNQEYDLDITDMLPQLQEYCEAADALIAEPELS